MELRLLSGVVSSGCHRGAGGAPAAVPGLEERVAVDGRARMPGGLRGSCGRTCRGTEAVEEKGSVNLRGRRPYPARRKELSPVE